MMRQILTIGLCLLLSFSIALSVGADTIKLRRVGVHIKNQRLQISFGYKDAFNAQVKKKLKSGLTTRVVVQLALEQQGSNTPVAFWAQTAEITYDLWEDKFVVTVEDAKGRRQARVRTQKEAINLAGTLIRAELLALKKLPSGTYRVRAAIETNPISDEMVEKIRFWLARSRAQKSSSSTQSNYFGSFVGSLVDHRIRQADHTIHFVSQWIILGGK